MSSDLLTRFLNGTGKIFPTEQLMIDKVGHPFENMMRTAPSERKVTFSENVDEKVINPNQDLIEPFFFLDGYDVSVEDKVTKGDGSDEIPPKEDTIIEPYSNSSFSQYGSPYGER